MTTKKSIAKKNTSSSKQNMPRLPAYFLSLTIE
ncbi:MAG: hypothetical protein QOG00_777, partial [Pyrinomonadaceae bacterium]|nr:hypothetical protein [Pyrinomonadaceae bacterium]